MASEGTAPNFDTFDLAEWTNDKRYIVQTVTLSRTGWKLISAIPKDELLQDLNTVQRLNIATYLVMIVPARFIPAALFHPNHEADQRLDGFYEVLSENGEE